MGIQFTKSPTASKLLKQESKNLNPGFIHFQLHHGSSTEVVIQITDSYWVL